LIVKQGRSLMLIEIKSSMTFNTDFIKPIRIFCERKKLAKSPTLIYAGDPLPDVHGVRCIIGLGRRVFMESCLLTKTFSPRTRANVG
jgi:hypothetical protein